MPKPSFSARVRAAAVVAGVVALGWCVWRFAVRDNVIPRNFGVVESGKIYRSASLTPAATERVVRDEHVKTIIDLGGYDKDPVGERVAAKTALALGIERHVFRLEGDGTGNPNDYVVALRLLNDPAKQPVLVHCSAGSQRTSAAVLLYRDIVQHQPMEQTLHEAIEHGHDPASNTKLMPYLKQWRDPIAKAFADRSWIPDQPASSEMVEAASGAGTP